MMKKVFNIFIVAVFFLPLFTKAQSQNILLDRKFWSYNPSLNKVKEEIKAGNDPVKLNPMGFNGTTTAILTGQPLETIKYLVSIEGNDVNMLTHDGRNYVHWAAMRGDVELIKFLISRGAKTDIVDDHGYSVLNFAATTGQNNIELYDYLLANGSQLSETNHDGANALLLIIPHSKDFTLINYFVKKGLSLEDTDKEGNGAFYYAAKAGNIEIMDELIKKGVAYKALNEAGGNAMLAAAQGARRSTNSIDVFKYLEGKGIEANITTKDGTTPLHFVARNAKDTEVISYFISKGVDVNRADSDGNTPLMIASQRGNLEIVSLLAGKTKDINTANDKGETVLTNAVADNSTEIVTFLLDKGAKVDVTDKNGNNIGFYLMKSYRAGGAHGGSAAGQSEAEGDPFSEKLEILKKQGFNPTSVQAEGKTLFHLAAEKNDLKLLKKVHQMGVDVNKADDEGTTPLQIAAMKATNDKILKYLLEIGADKSITTSFDETVYDLASENEMLQANGVNINFLK
ncbi:ankyrin repeat domain-containing protein [Chondrinema litorale]|uniref:ankyrin repeat domain-containing protein n=1 Tax=Chondrinema litorale TaxID=2994555 RepID=UPI0025432CA0|nr:ankyrin repeat domain-containing protein [Chondrinema litorale]UZR99640.1 ankyrin repeat domain-containing protein [Chondrinema litorale]